MSEVIRLTGSEPDLLIDQLATIHREEIQSGVLSTLGMAFLNKLYRTLASGPHSFVFILVEGGAVSGFICGALDTGAVYRDFARRAGLRAFLIMLPRLLSMGRIRRIMETVLYPSRQKADDLPSAEILNFCVRSQWQRHGIGGKLFAALCEEFRARGVESIRIVTGERQESARHFYESKGAACVREIEVHRGARSFVYVYKTASRIDRL